LIRPHPAGVTMSFVRKRSEPDAEWTTRLELHQAAVLRERVDVRWIYQPPRRVPRYRVIPHLYCRPSFSYQEFR
jgi:hypothetical protein